MLTYGAKRGLSALLLSVALAFSIAAVCSTAWVSQSSFSSSRGAFDLGLRGWKLRDTPYGDSDEFGYGNPGVVPYLWNDNLMGDRSDWQAAGRAALGLGVIGIVLCGLALLLTALQLARPATPKLPGAVLSFVSGFAFLLGAILYEGLRPAWSGDVGYEWPMGLYLTAGVGAELSCFLLWAADYTSRPFTAKQ